VAYGDNTLGASHRWSFNNVLTDSIGALTLANTGGAFVTTPSTRDATHCYQTNGRDDLAVVATTTDTGSAGFSQYAFHGWFMTDSIQGPPTLIYKQGGDTSGFALFLWGGNAVMLQVKDINGNNNIQIFSDIKLTTNRWYNFFVRYSGSGFNNEVELYIDALKQTSNKDGVTPGAASMTAHTGNHNFGENGTTGTDVSVGSSAGVLVKAPVNGFWSEWWTWEGSVADAITQTQIDNDLVGAGATPEVTITAGTQAAMQAQLDTYIGTTRGDEPLCFLVEEVTGGGNLNLTADNITFNSRASIHVRYEGTGTLNWTNENGSDAVRINGNVIIINPTTATFTNLITGGEFRLYEDDGIGLPFGTELGGIEALTGTTFQYDHSGASLGFIIQHMAAGYEEIILRRTLSSSNQTFTLNPQVDTNI